MSVAQSSFEEQTNSYLLMSEHGTYALEETENAVQDNSGEVFFPGSFFSRQKSIHGKRLMKTATIFLQCVLLRFENSFYIIDINNYVV